MFTQIIITQKDSMEGIGSSKHFKSEKKKGKKKLGHRDRVKSQLEISLSTIKERKSKILSKLSK